MPTRNRGNLLRFALQSALAQTFADYEIVICDNQSSDNTPEIVRDFPDPRVRYYRTEKVLPMHENWEYALGKAQGEWITYLCDDDAIRPGLLDALHRLISRQNTRLITWNGDTYCLDGYPLTHLRGRLLLNFASTGRVETRASRPDLKTLFQMNPKAWHFLPRVLNSCVHRDTVEKVRHRLGRFFLPSAPDYAGCAALLALEDTYTHIDSTFTIAGVGAHVIGFSPTYNQVTIHLHFTEDFQGQPLYRWVPLEIMTAVNAITDSILAVKHAMPDKLADCEVDWPRYFAECYMELLQFSGWGFDVSSLKRHWFEVLSHRPLSFRVRVFAAIARRPKGYLLDLLGLRGVIYRSWVLGAVQTLIRGRKTVAGNKLGNIMEAVEHLEHSAPLPPIVLTRAG